MKFTLYFAILLVFMLCYCQNAYCQEYDLDQLPISSKPSGSRHFNGKRSSSSPRATNISAKTPTPIYYEPTAARTSNRQPPYHAQSYLDYPFGTPNQRPGPIPFYTKPNHYPSGLSLKYRLSPAFTSANRPYENRQICLPQVLVSSPGSSTASRFQATDDEILQLTEALYYKESNSQFNKISVNIQGKTRSVDNTDKAPQPLLRVNPIALQTPTIAKLRDLLDNYDMDTSKEECVTSTEQKEEDDFIDAVMATNVMRQAMLFLISKGIVSSDPKTQRNLLKSIWFTQYSRGHGKLGSSGFEHVFLNEVKNGKIIGLHNWVYFNQEEKAGRLDYKGYLSKIDLGNKGTIIKARFTHNGLTKPVNSLFIGTSPELELALYTVCFALRSDKICPVSLGGNKFGIQTYSWKYQGQNLIGSAYPIVYPQNANYKEYDADEQPIRNYPRYFRRYHGQQSSFLPRDTYIRARTPTYYYEPISARSAGRQPPYHAQSYLDYPFGTPNQRPSPIPFYPKPNQYPSGHSLNYGLSPAFTSVNRPYENRQICLPQVLPSSPNFSTTGGFPTTDYEIRQLTEALYNKETNSQLNKISVNIQGKTRSVYNSDEAPQPLLRVNPIALQTPTIAKLLDLFDNYELDTSKEECVTSIEQREENDFIDAVMATNVMHQAMLFLQIKGIVSSDPKSQRDLLKTIWFTQYSRGQGKLGSSGFEHVFVNEVKNGKIIGLHNWVYFNQEEKAGRLDYKGYLNKIDLGNKGTVVMARFTHNGLAKPVNSLFIGTSPELELALYTVCFTLRSDKICPVSLGGKGFGIQTYSWKYQGYNLIGSAYPII